MSFVKSPMFKYAKNLIIGVGAAVVMIGALGKINSEPWGGTMITIGLMTEAFLFLMLGVLPPEKDYYWEKLYPGLDQYGGGVAGASGISASSTGTPLNGEVVENKLGGMLSELQNMSKSLSSLKALQEVDFSETSEQLKTMHNFYTRMGEAMKTLNDTVEDTKLYKEQMVSLNKNLTSLNSVYGNVLNAFQVRQN
ncbi:MAG: gliding motility protein GldL [Saprospiraceae bacterium]|nr:gliding motility protein GldL [Saprospiraceae bacterium]